MSGSARLTRSRVVLLSLVLVPGFENLWPRPALGALPCGASSRWDHPPLPSPGGDEGGEAEPGD